MKLTQISLLGAATAALAGAVFAQKPRAAQAAPAPTPGQLEILDRKGQPTGLCPLKHTDVKADVAGPVARVTVKQQFHNPSSEPVEAVYTFPLPEDAAVDDMTMRIGDRLVKGQIKRREEARAIYEAAKNAGQAAALLDQERPNIFTQAVANVMPGADVTIEISYVNLLKYQEGRYEFSFPMVVGPRFVPGGGHVTPGERGRDTSAGPLPGGAPGSPTTVTDAAKITPPITPQGTRAGHDISLTVDVDAGVPIQDVKSQLHDVIVEKPAPTRAVVKLRPEDSIPNKDFILRYTVAGSQIQTGVLAHAPGTGSGYFTMILQPPAAPPQKDIAPKEMVFVIDQTGSQSGLPIQKSKETIKYCLENLNPGDTFQLIGFNTDVFPCFTKPLPVTPENVQAAMRWLQPIEGRGGTDILKSVDYALRIPDDPGRPRIICYMTDGYVGNDMQIVDYIRKNRGRARMFPFGVGNSVNRFLIDAMATEGRGAPEYVDLRMPGEQAASRFYDRVARPLLLDVQVDWNGLAVEDVYPKAIPDVFTSGPIVLKGRYKGAPQGDITVRGLLRGQPWSQTVHVAFPAVRKDDPVLATLWAREKIADLQAQDWYGAQSGQPDPKIKDQIVGTALDYRLMSQYTSFVAVEQRVVNVGGKQRTIDVPVEMPEGVSYEGIFGEQERASRLSLAKTPAAASGAYFRSRGAQPAGGAGFGGFAGAPAQRGPAGPGGSPGLASATPPPAPAAKPAPALNPAPQLRREAAKLDVAERVGDRQLGYGLAEGKAEALKQLADLKPEEQRAVLAEVKLAPALQGLADRVKKEGKNGSLRKEGVPAVEKGRVEVQIWLNDLPADGLKKLKALGFDLAATLRPGKLLLGTVSVDRLDELIALPWVRRVEPPKYLD